MIGVRTVDHVGPVGDHARRRVSVCPAVDLYNFLFPLSCVHFFFLPILPVCPLRLLRDPVPSFFVHHLLRSAIVENCSSPLFTRACVPRLCGALHELGSAPTLRQSRPRGPVDHGSYPSK